MGWKVTFGGTKREEFSEDESVWEGGTVVLLDDLPLEKYDEIAALEDGATWLAVYVSPVIPSSRMWQVAIAAAIHADVQPPPKPSTVTEAMELLSRFSRTPDIADQPVVDDFPPTPSETENG